MTFRRFLSFLVAALTFSVSAQSVSAQRRGSSISISRSSSRPIFRPSTPRPIYRPSAPVYRASTPTLRTYSRPSTTTSSSVATYGRRSAATMSPSRTATTESYSTSSRTLSSADQALARRAQAQGTIYYSRSDAVSAFKARTATQYTTSFASPPKVRPSYIPTQTQVGGKTYSIGYNPSYHSYGYIYGGGWRTYDPYSDPVVLASLMTNQGYYYQQPVVVPQSSNTGVSGKTILTVLIVAGLVIVVVGAAFLLPTL